ncbi:MAG: hypothetical protein FWF09_04030 [Bacteroidales bacterium]|nr:hypothetical protein [Bacteroidales bacterium]
MPIKAKVPIKKIKVLRAIKWIKARRREGAKARKHEGTKARKHESTKARM